MLIISHCTDQVWHCGNCQATLDITLTDLLRGLIALPCPICKQMNALESNDLENILNVWCGEEEHGS